MIDTGGIIERFKVKFQKPAPAAAMPLAAEGSKQVEVKKTPLNRFDETHLKMISASYHGMDLGMEQFMGETVEELTGYLDEMKRRNNQLNEQLQTVDRTYKPSTYNPYWGAARRNSELHSDAPAKEAFVESQLAELGDKSGQFWMDGTMAQVEERFAMARLGLQLKGGEFDISGDTAELAERAMDVALADYQETELLSQAIRSLTIDKNSFDEKDLVRQWNEHKFGQGVIDHVYQKMLGQLREEIQRLEEKGESLGVVRGSHESLRDYQKRLGWYEKLSDEERQGIEGFTKGVIERINTRFAREDEARTKSGSDLPYRYDSNKFNSCGGRVYRATGELPDGCFQVAPVFRHTEYEGNLDKLRVASDMLERKIEASVDVGRLIFMLKETGGAQDMPFFSSSSRLEGAQMHHVKGEKIIRVELPPGQGIDIDSGLKQEGKAYSNEGEVAIWGYIDPEWGQVYKTKETANTRSMVGTKPVPSYFGGVLETEMGKAFGGLSEREKRYFITYRRQADDENDWPSRLALRENRIDDFRGKVFEKMNRANTGTYVALRMQELLNLESVPDMNSEYPQEKVAELLKDEKTREIMARLIAGNEAGLWECSVNVVNTVLEAIE